MQLSRGGGVYTWDFPPFFGGASLLCVPSLNESPRFLSSSSMHHHQYIGESIDVGGDSGWWDNVSDIGRIKISTSETLWDIAIVRHCLRKFGNFLDNDHFFAAASPANYKNILFASILKIRLRNLCFAFMKRKIWFWEFFLNFVKSFIFFKITLSAYLSHYNEFKQFFFAKCANSRTISFKLLVPFCSALRFLDCNSQLGRV